MKRSYRFFIALGVLLMAVALAAMVYLLASGPGAGTDTVPTEVQIFGTTTTSPTSGASIPTTLGLRATTTRPAATTTQRPAKDANGLTIVRAEQLPREAQQTLALIKKGGPYPYERDGVVFENREGLLPKKVSGFYREYTVVTPGSNDRGARRIVAGAGDERFYTADHYDTFVRVEVGP